MLVKTLAFKGKHKLADRWEEDICTVLEKPNDEVAVYVVQREDGKGPKRTLHRNHLLPIGSLPFDSVKVKKSETEIAGRPGKLQSNDCVEKEIDSDMSSGEEDILIIEDECRVTNSDLEENQENNCIQNAEQSIQGNEIEDNTSLHREEADSNGDNSSNNLEDQPDGGDRPDEDFLDEQLESSSRLDMSSDESVGDAEGLKEANAKLKKPPIPAP